IFMTYWGLFNLMSCQAQVAIDDISNAPKVIPSDKKLADVFKPLDGAWVGKFYIYLDEFGQSSENPKPKNFDKEIFKKPSLKLQRVVEVQQKYISESPYFQRVTINDTYGDERGVKKGVTSYGVNKVQDGKLWCVIVKPDEKVIHSGSTEGEQTIVWQRNIRKPLKIEYFKETVLDDEYTISGWGYYGDDDPDLSPRYWFHGIYKRKE
ncbi:MAG: hypothetical protein ACE5HX_15125, partial [bacterium]